MMSGKLPIDRVRDGEDAPRVYEDHKQRFSEKEAELRELGRAPVDTSTISDEEAPSEGDDA